VRKGIFEAFTQADRSTTRKYGGSGLGLAICSRLVTLMEGVIDLKSEVGRGSTFRFSAVLGVDPAATPRPSAPLAALRDLAVLVVDDNDTNRHILEEVLRAWRMAPTCVADGAQALRTLRSAAAEFRPFRLVLLDYLMPAMTGLELATQIRDDAAVGEPKLIMLSSATHLHETNDVRGAGIQRSLAKPIVESELLDAILSCMQNEIMLHPVPTGGADTPPQRGRPLRVLLAEDGHINQVVAVAILEERGHSVRLVEDGLEAIQAHQEEVFDLILMDLRMPNMDGYEATRWIRKNEAGRSMHTPIVALTAGALEGDRERCLAAGMDAHIPKPIDTALLFETINALVPTDEGPL